MLNVKPIKRRAFTLIELLVVVAIIALLISVLLPSLQSAREKARAAKCGVTLKQMGTGLETYYTEFNEWIPGINTTGIPMRTGPGIDQLTSPTMPVQSYDWITPFMHYSTAMGKNRAEKFRTILTEFGCPSMTNDKIDLKWDNGETCADDSDFTDEIVNEFAPVSFLMPMHFQWWGQVYAGTVVARGVTSSGRPINIPTSVSGSAFAAVHNGSYKSKRNLVGQASEKIAAADGMRYLGADGIIDVDIRPDPEWFGAFCSNGAWWGGSEAYGVKPGTANWDGMIVNTGENPDAEGRAMAWSYRHRNSSGRPVTDGCRSNSGAMNALFFDGHVERLDDRQSRHIGYWYPKGTTVQNAAEGLTKVEDETVQ